jgi:ribosomal-protein-serine acetyltransferase
MFTYPLGADAVLIPRTPAIADAFHELLVANQQRLSRWDPGACPDPLTLEETRSRLERNANAWLDGTQLPVAIATTHQSGRQLVGAANLRLTRHNHSGELGYWIDVDHEGQGLVTRAVIALINHGFGPLGLHRITLATDADNHRSQALARRLGFSQEGVLRQAFLTHDGRRDEIIYGLLASEWRTRDADPARPPAPPAPSYPRGT